MRTNQLTDDTLRSLAEVEAAEPVVVSLFLDLDPSEFATAPARASQITSLLSDLDALLREGERSRDALESLTADRARLEAFLRDDDLDAARILRGGPSGLREIRGVRSDVKNQHSAGGWSQRRFERSVERDVESHLEEATGLLLRQFERRPFDHLVVGANAESLRPALTGEAHSYLLERVRGWVDIDEQLASPAEVLEAVRPVMDEQADAEERALFERIAAEQGTDGRAAVGLDAVLGALVERRVETL